MSWQSMENMMYMSYFLATKSVPVVAAGASVVFAVSPWQTVKTIQQAKSTLQFPFAPFFFYFISSVIYTLYAFVTSNLVMGATALLGSVLGSYYVFVYYTHAGDKTQPTRMLTYSLVFLVLLSLAVSHSPAESALIIGVPGNILSVLTAASPLLQVKTILRLKDASCLPFGMSVMNVVAGGVWMVYGLMLGDPLVILPNMFALTMGIIQTSLIILYPGAAALKGHKPAPPLASPVPVPSPVARGRAKSSHEKAHIKFSPTFFHGLARNPSSSNAWVRMGGWSEQKGENRMHFAARASENEIQSRKSEAAAMAFKLALKREKERIQSELERDVPNENERLYVLKAPSSQSTRSDVWNHMHFVHERQGDNGARRVTFRAGPNSRDTEFVACVRCLKVWSFLPTSGTNTLKQHKCPAAAVDVKVTAVASGGPVVRRERRTQGDKVSSMKNGSGGDDKKRVAVASSSPDLQVVLTTFCAQDLQPFDIVHGEGFKNLIQTVLDVAFKHKGKRLLVQDLIPTPAEVRNNAVARANAGRVALKRILQAHLSTGVYIACSLNIWADDAKDIAYVSVTVHYITDQFELVDRTLYIQPIRNASHTRIVLEEEFHEALKSFGLDQFKKEQFIVVSANRAGPEDVRSVYDWHPSVDHQIASCLSTVFNKPIPQQQSGRRITAPSYKYFGEAPEVFNLIDDCKELVAYFKHEDLQRRLSKPLKQENDASRWNSLHRCLASVDEALSEIIDVLMKQNRMDKIARVGEDLLRELTVFLSEFKLATLALERFNVPTIHEVVYWRHRLLAHLDVYDEAAAAQVPADSESIASLKYLIRPIVEEKFQVEVIHVVAALLDPAQKHRLHKFGVSEHQIDVGYQQLKKYMKAIGSSASAVANEADSLLPLAKKQRTEPRRGSIVVSQYSDDDDDGDDDDGEAATSAGSLDFHVAAEFAKYLQYKVSKNERLAMLELSKQELNPIKRSDDEFQLLTWWKHVGSPAFPILSRVARSILCIPASSARSESNGSMKTTTRSQLSPSTVNDLMFLRSNHDL